MLLIATLGQCFLFEYGAIAAKSFCAAKFAELNHSNVNLSAESIRKSFSFAFSKMSRKVRGSFQVWAMEDSSSFAGLLERLDLTQENIAKSWRQPVVILRQKLKKGSDIATIESTLVLYRGHILPGNYFQVKGELVTAATAPGKAMNLDRARRGQPGIEILPGGKARLIPEISPVLWMDLARTSGETVTLYRGASEFEFKLMQVLKRVLGKDANAFASPEDIQSIRRIVEDWSFENRVEHWAYARSIISEYPVWRRLIRALEANPLSNENLFQETVNAMNTEFLNGPQIDQSYWLNHKKGTFTTPEKNLAFSWAFDSESKLRTGRVLRFDVPTSIVSPSVLDGIYTGVEGSNLEVGFFSAESRKVLIQSMADTAFSKADDPRKNPAWRKKEAVWEARWKAMEKDYQNEQNFSEMNHGNGKQDKSLWDLRSFGSPE